MKPPSTPQMPPPGRVLSVLVMNLQLTAMQLHGLPVQLVPLTSQRSALSSPPSTSRP